MKSRLCNCWKDRRKAIFSILSELEDRCPASRVSNADNIQETGIWNLWSKRMTKPSKEQSNAQKDNYQRCSQPTSPQSPPFDMIMALQTTSKSKCSKCRLTCYPQLNNVDTPPSAKVATTFNRCRKGHHNTLQQTLRLSMS